MLTTVRLGSFIGPTVFVSGSSGLLKQVKGWRHFTIADGLSRGGASAPFRPTCRPLSLMSARKGRRPFGPKPEERGKDRAIDPMSGRNTSA